MSDYSLGISFSLWDIFDAAKVPSCEVLQEVMNKFAKFQSYEKSISCFVVVVMLSQVLHSHNNANVVVI